MVTSPSDGRAKSRSEGTSLPKLLRFVLTRDTLPWLASCVRHAVDCWIGVADETDRRLVRLAGRLSVAQVPELLGACASGVSIQVDLTDLVSVDVAGIEALQRLRTQGALLVGAPGYLQLKLDSHQGATAGLPAPRRQTKGSDH